MGDSERVASALRELGIQVDSVWDLVNTGASYRSAIPVLLELLPSVTDRRAKEGIVRALSVRNAGKPVAEALIAEMRTCVEDETVGWAIGNALSIVVAPSDGLFDELAELSLEESLGAARQMLADALIKTKDPRAFDVLIKLLSQEDMTGHALFALGALKSPRAEPHIRGFLEHSNRWIRKEAKRALTKIEKARNKASAN